MWLEFKSSGHSMCFDHSPVLGCHPSLCTADISGDTGLQLCTVTAGESGTGKDFADLLDIFQ